MTGQAFVFTSASKGWNIPGLKCGVAVAGSEQGCALLEQRAEALLAAHLGVLASVAALTGGLPWLDAALGQLDENRALLAGLLREHLPAVGYVQPQASFLAWLDCRALGLGDDPSAVFLDRGRVAVSRGPNFGSPRFGSCLPWNPQPTMLLQRSKCRSSMSRQTALRASTAVASRHCGCCGRSGAG